MRAAQALERAFALTGESHVVQHVDVLQYTNPLFRRLHSRAYLKMVDHAPEVLGWLYDRMDEPFQNEELRLAFDRLNTRPLRKLFAEFKPDVILCTHFLPAEIVSWMKRVARLDVRHGVIVTDFDVHAMWMCRTCEQYYVPIEETRVHLRALGVPEDLISVTGIPIDPVFSQPLDRSAARAKLGLATDRTTLLVSAGGFGVGPVEHLVQSLGQLQSHAQVVMVCGRNDALRERLQPIVRDTRTPIHLIGFTDVMHEYMSAADLLVGKPGGLTTSEALAKGLVMVIVNPIPGQEERNSDHLLEEGAAIRCNNLPALAWKIDSLIADQERFERMRANAIRLGRPNAALEIVKHALH